MQSDSRSMQIPWFQCVPTPKLTFKHFCLIRSSKWVFVRTWNIFRSTSGKTGFWAKTNFSAFSFFAAPFWGGPWPYFQPWFPPLTLAFLFTSEVPAFYQPGFSIPVSAQLRFLLWNYIYTVCTVLMCFTVFSCSHAHSPAPSKHTDIFPTMVGNISLSCLCVFPRVHLSP